MMHILNKLNIVKFKIILEEILPDDNITDIYGWVNIPSEKSFWMVLMKDFLYVLSSRRNMLASSVYSLNLNDIFLNNHENKDFNGV
jgi:hypothetical protein